MGKGKLTQSWANRAGHESPEEDCGPPHQTVGVNWGFPIWLCPRQRHNRRNLCSQAAARELYSCQQEALHGFCRPGEGIWWSASKVHLVSVDKTWCELCDWCRGWMPMSGAMFMLVRSTVKRLKWRSVFTKTRYSARCSLSLCLKRCHKSSALGSPGRTSFPRPCYQCWIAWGMC